MKKFNKVFNKVALILVVAFLIFVVLITISLPMIVHTINMEKEGIVNDESQEVYGAKNHGGYYLNENVQGEILSDDDGCTFIVFENSATFVGGCDFPSLLEK